MKCKIQSCNNTTSAKGLCNKHYLRKWKHGDVYHKDESTKVAFCVEENCNSPVRSGFCQYCEKHYYRIRRTGTTAERQRKYSLNELTFDIIDHKTAWLMG